MFKSLFMAAVLTLSVAAQANTNSFTFELQKKIVSAIELRDWKVGEEANYSLEMGVFIKGSMFMAVKAYDSNGLLLTQNMDLGFAGKQNCEILIDTSTGKTKKLTCNGKDQDVGEEGQVEVIEMKEATVTVPAGTFDCAYIRAKNKKDDTEIQQWVNPSEVAVLGLIKTVMPSQFGEVKIELTSQKKIN